VRASGRAPAVPLRAWGVIETVRSRVQVFSLFFKLSPSQKELLPVLLDPLDDGIVKLLLPVGTVKLLLPVGAVKLLFPVGAVKLLFPDGTEELEGLGLTGGFPAPTVLLPPEEGEVGDGGAFDIVCEAQVQRGDCLSIREYTPGNPARAQPCP